MQPILLFLGENGNPAGLLGSRRLFSVLKHLPAGGGRRGTKAPTHGGIEKRGVVPVRAVLT